MAKDSRLLESLSPQQIDENFTRILAIIEALEGESVYQVLFNSNGGSAVTTQYALIGQKLTEPSNPTKANYVFAGWFTDTGLTDKWTFASDLITDEEKSFTLYAKWTPAEFDLTVTPTACTVVVTSGGKTITVGEDAVYHTQVLTITATPDEGYEVTTLTVNGEAFVSGSNHTVNGANVVVVATATLIGE